MRAVRKAIQKVEVLRMRLTKTNGRGLGRLLCFLLAAAMLAGILPAMAAGQHGMLLKDNVLFRKQAVSTADHWGYLNSGWVVEILGTATGSGFEWFKIKSDMTNNSNIYTGYVRSDMLRRLTADEETRWAQNPVQGTLSSGGASTVPPVIVTEIPGSVPSAPNTMGYVKVIKKNTNLRNKPDGLSVLQLGKDVILPYYGREIAAGGRLWIYVLDTKSNNYGYIRNDCYQFVTAEGKPTAGPGKEPLYTPAVPAQSYAYVTVDAANLRQTAGGYSVTALPAGAVVRVTGALQNGWYPVEYNGYIGFMAAVHLRVMTAEETQKYLNGGASATATPAPYTPYTPSVPGTSTGYVRVTADRVNLRNKPDGLTITQMGKNQIIPCYGAPQYAGGVMWQYVYYTPAAVYGYVHQKFIQYTDEKGNPVQTPAPSVTQTPAPAQTGFIKLTKNGVNLRQTAGGESLMQMKKGTILPCSDRPFYQGGYYWVYAQEPVSLRWGYVRSDCYTFTDKDGNAVTPPSPATPAPYTPPVVTAVPQAGAIGTVELVKGGVNLRVTADGPIIARLDRGTRLNYYGVTYQAGYSWYYVVSQKGSGYVRGDMAKVVDGTTPSVPGVTPAPQAGGYIILTKSNVNLRNLPDGLTLVQLAKGKVYPITGPVVSKAGYNWYFITSEHNTGYVRSDCLRQLTEQEESDYKKGIMPKVTPGGTAPQTAEGHLITVGGTAILRTAPGLDAAQVAQTAAGAVLPYRGSVTGGGYLWYLTTYNNQSAYILASYARIMSAEEYAQWLKNNGGATPQPGATVDPSQMSDVAVTVRDRVLVRKQGSMSAPTLSVVYRSGTRVRLLGAAENNGGYLWRYVTAAGVNGWIRGDMLRVLSKSEAGGNAPSNPSNPGTNPPATYRTLRKGMSGADVTRLQQTLVALGLMQAGQITGIYDTVTEKAVRAYQASAHLFVDGVAGQKTQDALYGTKPSEPQAPNVDKTIYPVEIVDWYKGDIQSLFSKGSVATLTDVKTGLSFRVKRWSGGFHADVEPLTAADTAVMCKIYGVSRAQEISDKNMYQRRPLWVTLKGRTICASMYGVPHNYPAGDTIPNNDFYGQFCVHFLNSRTHNKGVVDANHMAAIQYAYDHAPARK